MGHKAFDYSYKENTRMIKIVLTQILNFSGRNHLENSKYVLTIASFIYLISNIGWMFAHGVFWDDWCVYENPIGIKQMMSGNGGVWAIDFYLLLLNFSRQINVDVASLYRIVLFLIGFINVCLYFCILKQLRLNNVFVFFSTIMFASWPLGYSHMLMCCFFYQAGVLFQLLAIFLFIIVINRNNHILSLGVFVSQYFASMFLNSTIVFWFGFLIVMATVKTFKDFSCTFGYAIIWLKKVLCYSVYFLPCLVFWVMRMVFWMPTGLYASSNYNTITFQNVVRSPLDLLRVFMNTLSFIFNQFAFISSSILFLLVFLTILFVIVFLTKNRVTISGSMNLPFVISLIFMSVCSIVPYILVGKILVFDSVDDRYGILLTLIVPLIIVSLLLHFKSNSNYLVFTFVSLFCTYSLSQSLEAIRLSHRNDAIMEFFKKNELPSGNVIVVEEQCPKLGSNFYSWAGLYHKATGLQNRCFELICQGRLYDGSEYFTEQYCQKDAKTGAPTFKIYFVNEEISYIATFKRLLMLFVDQVKYKQMVLKDFDIRWERISCN